MERKYIDANEAAAYLGVKMNTLYKLTSKKRIPYYSPGGRKIMFKLEELDRWIESGRVATNEELECRCHNVK